MANIPEALEAKRNVSNFLQVSLDRQSENDRAIRDLKSTIAALEEQQTSARKAKALGRADVAEPAMSVIADHKLDLAGREAAAEDLAGSVRYAQANLKKAENQVVIAVNQKIANEHHPAALKRFKEILEAAFEQAQVVIGVDALMNYDFRPEGVSERNWHSVEERAGPAAQIIAQIQRLNWGTHPYSLRPNWAPRNTPPIVSQMPGVKKAKDDILRELGLEGLL